MTDVLTFLEDDGDALPAETIGGPAEPQPQPQPEPDPAEQPEPEPQQPPQPGHVPIAAMLEWRDKAQAREAELARYREREQRQQSGTPDPYEDPQGFAAFAAEQTQQAVLNAKLDLSEDMARDKHGDGAVDTAREWALQRMETSPAFRAEVLGHRNPYGYVVQQFQRDQALTKLSDPADVDAFLAWRQAQPVAAPAAPPMRAAPKPPRSLASVPSAGGVQTQVEAEPFEAAFAQR